MTPVQPALDGSIPAAAVAQCIKEDCSRSVETRDMCNMHYLRWRKALKKAGLPLPPAPPKPRPIADLGGSTPHDEQYRERTRRRIAAHSKPDSTGCWLWMKSLDRDGYGVCQAQGRDSAHRVCYLAFVGPIPAGMVIDHRCHSDDETCAGGTDCAHRRCVNPAHLEPVAPGENTLRGRSPWAKNARKTHCHRGHEFTPENTNQRHDGRVCRACSRIASAAYKRRKKEAQR